MELGNLLKTARLKKGLSVYELAKLSKVSVTTISFAEKGKTKPYGKTLVKLAEALNIDIGELVKIEKE